MIPLGKWGRSLALVMTGLGVLAGAACSSPSSPGGAGAPSDSTGAGAPKVNRLVFGVGPPGNESNKPHVIGVGPSAQLMPMHDFLVGMTPEGKEDVPQLATEWRLDTDGKSYRMKLRQGIPFHRGFGEFTAKDVRFTWEEMKNEKDIMSPQPTQVARQDIQDVEIVNDYEVIIRLTQPNSGFFSALTQSENVFAIRSKADGESRQQPPTLKDFPLATTGSYQYLTREQTQYIRYERVPYQHWRKTPDFPEFEWRFFKEPSTMLAALLAKEIHAAGLPPDQVPQAEKAGMRGIPGKAPGQHAVVEFLGVYLNKRTNPDEKLNPDPNATFVHPNSPFLDVRVRKALNKAIDKDALNKAFLGGKGEPMYNRLFHPTRPGWNPDWEKNFKQAYGYDPAEARKLLAEAGYGPNNPLNLTVQLRAVDYFPAVMDMQEAVGSNWRAVGVNVTLEQADAATISRRGRALEYDSHAYINVTGIRQWLGINLKHSNLGGSRNGPQLPEMDEVWAETRRTMDPKRYEELLRKWGDMAYERYLNGPLFWLSIDTVVNPAIVSDYVYPGSVSYIYTHVEYLKAAK